MSEEYSEYRARGEEERRIDNGFIACRRYYKEINAALDTRALGVGDKSIEVMREEYAELIGSADTLKEQFNYVAPEANSAAMTPSLDLFVHEKRQAIEQFKLLPLRELSLLVDETYPLDRAQRWYECLVDEVRRNDEFHGVSCLTTTYKHGPQACRHSMECPTKVLRYELLSPALLGDFEDPMYIFEPTRKNKLVEMKLNVAAKKGIEDPMAASVALNVYNENAR